MTHSAYLIFNLLVIIVPALCSFMPQFQFLQRWKEVISAILPMALIFLIWDFFVIGRHWWFHPSYISGLTIAHIPIEEIAFFFTVPYACLFVWQILKQYLQVTTRTASRSIPLWSILLLTIFTEILFICGKEYTGLVSLALTTLLLLQPLLKNPLARFSTLIPFICFVLIATFICNGFLTVLPITIYDLHYQVGIHVWTIPIEDFIYGLVLIMGNVTLFEYQLQSKQIARRR